MSPFIVLVLGPYHFHTIIALERDLRRIQKKVDGEMRVVVIGEIARAVNIVCIALELPWVARVPQNGVPRSNLVLGYFEGREVARRFEHELVTSRRHGIPIVVRRI